MTATGGQPAVVTTSQSKNSITFGGKVYTGYEFPSGWLVEANYQLIGKVGGIDPSGYGLQIGFKFR